MSIIDLFRRREPDAWTRDITVDGLLLSRSSQMPGARLSSKEVGGLVRQLLDDGIAQEDEDRYFISWDALFDAMSISDYQSLHEILALPQVTTLRPVLSSRNSLADEDFAIWIGHWQDPDGQQFTPEYLGAILRFGNQQELMTGEQWELFKDVTSFARRSGDLRNKDHHLLCWGRIRRKAVAAQAVMSDFLVKTIVLTPERLNFAFRKSDAVLDDTVIEVIPTFEKAPESWLEQFDRFGHVPDRYDIPVADGGLIQVVIAPEVRTVLEQIKRFPGRRIAGSRAQAFLLNPFSTLGEDASKVIDESQFEKAKEEAGFLVEHFSPVIVRDDSGFPMEIGIRIESADTSGQRLSDTIFIDDDQLRRFLNRLEHSITNGFPLVSWQGHEIEVLPEAKEHLRTLRIAMEQRLMPRVLVTYEQVHDLSAYSSRIDGIGIEKPYYSPYIAKMRSDEGWFPENVFPVIAYTPDGSSEPIAIPIGNDELQQLREAAAAVYQRGESFLSLPWLPKPMSVEEARRITATFDQVLTDVEQRKFDPEKYKPDLPRKKKTLVLRANIESVDYEERRAEALRIKTPEPKIPRTIASGVSLLDHQREGIARLQYLYGLRNKFNVRGMVLADDMGLGKTFQILTLMASILESDANCLPMLVVAPVSLLENWKEEAEKFYPGVFRILTAHGKILSSLRLPRESIDARLRNEDGLVTFLKPGWVGDAKLVLTTYETLRDYEFSLACQRWSLMVCDEAQRIKNPAAMVTRAAKKQNAEFKIACTGTPVENSLVDLWCLFDFVQPGLLGALNEFGKTYRRPIEIKDRDEEGKRRIKELRQLIEPQILRRMKHDVAKDLPRKIVVDDCRNLAMSPIQRMLYTRAIDDFKKRFCTHAHTPFKNHFELLHYLRLVCTDPRRHGLTVFKPDPLSEYCKAAPKLDWLINQLEYIRRKGEKAIIFVELKNIQRMLQHYILEVFDYDADIINGDISASVSSATSRQKRIKAFQEKPGFGVIIMSPLAVGFGVNIQAANHVIHYMRTWNPAKEDQATARAWRIGQKREVYVYYPLVTANDFITFDVKLDQLLERKRSLAGDMLNGYSDVTAEDFNIEDIVPVTSVPSINEIVTLDMALRMDWRYFEGLAAVLWAKRGFEVYCTPATNDHGVDVVAITGDHGELVQTKTSGVDDRAIGWDAIKDVVTGEAYYRRLYPGVNFRKIVLTNQFFNASAHEAARLNGVLLMDQDDLNVLLNKYQVTMLEIERFIFKSDQKKDRHI